MPYVRDRINIENAELMFRNFSGKQTQYNNEGNRNFCVRLDQDTAEKLAADGWNIRYLKARDVTEDDQPYMQVSVSYRNQPPSIYLFSDGVKTLLDEDSVGMLDWADILNVDLVINPYNWEVNGKRGVKAYVKTMYVTIDADPFASKYNQRPLADAPDDEVPF